MSEEQKLTPSESQVADEALVQKPAAGQDELDPGGQAISDALLLTFRILKLIMIGVLVVIVCSGFYTVQPNSVAIVTRLGEIQGSGQDRLKTEGLNWKLPAPLEEVIFVPSANKLESLEIISLWHYETAAQRIGEEQLGPPGQQLQIARDGYTLTASSSVATFSLDEEAVAADYNIIHSDWTVNFHISDPIQFVQTLWDGTEAGWRRAYRLLEATLVNEVILVSAQQDIDWIVYGAPTQFKDEIEQRYRNRVEELNVGIRIKELVMERNPIPPRQVKAVFDQAAAANQDKEATISDARAEVARIQTRAQTEYTRILAEARAYRTEVAKSAESDAANLSDLVHGVEQTVSSLYPEDTADGRARRQAAKNEMLAVICRQKYQETVRRILGRAKEVIIVSSENGESVEWRPKLNRNPELGKKSTGSGLNNPEAR